MKRDVEAMNSKEMTKRRKAIANDTEKKKGLVVVMIS